jgi:hypothetical protein
MKMMQVIVPKAQIIPSPPEIVVAAKVTPVDDDDIIFDNLMLELKPDEIRSK